jgi:hypothetical protein
LEYSIEMVNEMAEKLRALPAVDDARRTLNKQHLVRHLASE